MTRRIVFAMAVTCLALSWSTQAQQLSAQDPEPPSQRGARAAHRLRIQYRDGTYELLSATAVTKTLPPSWTPKSTGPHSGFWYELKDGVDVLYRRRMRRPALIVYEGRDPDTRMPDRAEAIASKRVFSVLIPAGRSGQELVLFASPIEPADRAEAAREVARLPLSPVLGGRQR